MIFKPVPNALENFQQNEDKIGDVPIQQARWEASYLVVAIMNIEKSTLQAQQQQNDVNHHYRSWLHQLTAILTLSDLAGRSGR